MTVAGGCRARKVGRDGSHGKCLNVDCEFDSPYPPSSRGANARCSAFSGSRRLRRGKTRSPLVGDLRDDQLSVLNAGAQRCSGTHHYEGRGARRLPVPAAGLSRRRRSATAPRWRGCFRSPRKKDYAIAKPYSKPEADPRGHQGEPGPRRAGPALHRPRARHTFAAISLSEAGADLLAVSGAMGHARPSMMHDRYGRVAPAGLAPLMAKINETRGCVLRRRRVLVRSPCSAPLTPARSWPSWRAV